jgi:hypothetical protein
MDDLGIGILLTHLLDPAVDISTMRLKALYDLTPEADMETEHTMRGRVLRAHVDVVFLFLDIRDGYVYDFFHV